MKSDWFVTPAALSRARLDQLLGQEQLADKSGVSLRSIQGYERNEQRVRLETLRCLAKALAVEVRDIAALRESARGSKKGAARPDSATATNAAATSALPPRTQLETLVDLEREAGILPASVKTSRGPVETLTAKRLQDIFTAYALHDGARFTLTGKVDGMRGLPPAEATILGSRGGVAARFHIVKEVVPGKPVGVTVHTARKEETAKLQKHYGADVTLFVRVVVVPGEPRDDGPGFSSFITRITAKRPWTFLVEEVREAPRAAEAVKPKRKSGK
ncbi:MAG: helix-turn-helix domain-containing protein [Polyangiaceae bacterium]